MAERLSILNPHPKKLPGPNLLHHLVSRHSANESTAIDFLSSDGSIERVSYEKLHHRSNAIARNLRTTWEVAKSKSKPAHFIAPILIPQCTELYVSELAALKAGAAFCPLSLDIPEERLRFILKDVEAAVLLTTSAMRARLPELEDIEVISVDTVDSREDEEDVQIDIAPSQPAYIMYTSGSTGQPKGVILSHSAATQSLLAHDRHIPPFSRFLQFASPTFDVSVFEIFFPLFRGRTIVAGERRLLLNDLPAFVNRMDIDAAELTPSVASTLLRGRASLPNLKTLLTIGEMLKRDVVEEFGSTPSQDGILHGMYGPTEAAIHCTLQTPFSTAMSTSNIGIPLDTVSAFVIAPPSSEDPLSDNVQILAVDEEGELAIGGHQLADGYINRIEQTSASFINHSEYGRLYRTGDRARLTSHGHLECLGRIASGQVKLRGQRVELGEIEYAASATPGVRSTVADVITGSVVVFCVTNASITTDQVRQTCQEWLPPFMVPTHCLLLSTLPYLPSGKVDRSALRERYDKQIASQLSRDPEASETTKEIINVIGTVLQVPISTQTRLSAIGLDSLSSIRIASQLQRAGFPQLDAMVLLESETIQDIESRLTRYETSLDSLRLQSSLKESSSGLRDAVTAHAAVSGRLNQIEDVFTPTAVQIAMLNETAKDRRAYCNWTEFNVHGHEINRVQICLQQLTSHHALLRSGFLQVHNPDTPYAAIIWKTLSSEHFLVADRLDYNFAIRSEADLLHPCRLQLIESNGSVRILLQIHHALYDQWSIDILRCDLDTLLHAGNLVPSSISFQNVSAFQHARRDEATLSSSADFWQDLLLDFFPSLLPPMNGTKMPKKLCRTQWHELTSDLSSIRRKCRDLGCSVPAIFQATLSYLLGNYCGSCDVTFGMVVSGRHIPLEGIESVFGPCLATLPFRIDYSAARTRLDLLREVQSRNREIQKHAFTPLADIKRMLELSANAKLFNTLFVWQESTFSSTTLGNVVQEVDSFDQHEFDLVVEFEPTSDGVRSRVAYQQSLIAPDQIGVLIHQLKAMSEAIIDAPGATVSTLIDCFPSNLCSISNQNPEPQATACDLISAIESRARDDPDSPAVVFARSIRDTGADHGTLTYCELDKRSNCMARFLCSLQVLPDDLVCVCMEKSVEMYISILATFKAGAGYLPLTPETPTSRLRSILHQSKAKLCLCDDVTFSKFRSLGISNIVNVRTVDLSAFDTNGLSINPGGTHVAYTVFTSGSTGEPKGVVVTRQNLLGNLQALAELYTVIPGDRLLQACSQAFDVSVFEIFFAFYTGMCLCSAPSDGLFRDIEASIRSLRITHLSLTPTVAALIDPDKVPTVRFLVTAGEGMTELVHRRWAGRGLHQGYGPSETTNICTVKMHVSDDDVLGNIGRPLPNTAAFVVSLQSPFDILPLGSIGEFAFGGEQVFRGYLGMDDLNAEKIVNHPEFGRIYKSGDIGRILPDGTLLICGRKDDQVKIRGNRVELGEITAVLLDNSDVRDCATLLIGDEAANQSLVSFVVFDHVQDPVVSQNEPATGREENLLGLFNSLEQSLPSYMTPRFIIPIERLPLTSQGKLDQKNLRRIVESLNNEDKASFAQDRREVDTAEEWSAEEVEIATALSDTVRISASTLLRHRSFFSLGLNSLNAISFAKALEARLKAPVAVSTVLRNSTIARLARILSELESNKRSHIAPSLLPVEVTTEVRALCESFQDTVQRILPCTPLQESMLAASVSSTERRYFNSLTLIFNGNVQKMKDCWVHMMKRHDILRTRFISTSNPMHPYVQVVLKDSPLPWRVHGLDSRVSSSPTDHHINGDERLTELQPFEICISTCLRETRVKIRMHHAVYDAISMATLLREVELTYRGFKLPEPLPFEPFLCEVQRQNGEGAIAYWKAEFNGFLPMPLPVAAPGSAEEVMLNRQTNCHQIDVTSFCQRHSVSQLAVFQAALVKILACSQQAADICFGNVVSGRTVSTEGIERLVAPCFNTIPIRTIVGAKHTNLALLRHLTKKNSDILEVQLTSLRRIQRLSAEPSARLFSTLLIFQPAFLSLDASIWREESEAGDMGLPLVFEVTPEDRKYALTLHFSNTYITPELARDLIEAYHAALIDCLNYPLSDVESFHHFDGNRIAGRLQRRSDPEDMPESANKSSDDDWTSQEQIVRRVYSQLSSVPERSIERETSLYQLGLDSLNAPQLASRLRDLGFEVDAADVMETLTPAALADLIETKPSPRVTGTAKVDLNVFHIEHIGGILKSLHLGEESIEAIRPCTSIQNGMLAQSLTSKGGLYVNHITYTVPDKISVAEIEEAWNRVICRDQILRSGFYQLDSGRNPFAMIIYQAGTAGVPLVKECTMKDHGDAEREISQAIVHSLQHPPWRVTIQQHTTGRSMTLSLHHALYDARSLSVIVSDFADALSGITLPPPTDIDSLLGAILAAEADRDGQAARYWEHVLRDLSIPKFPDLTPTSVNDSIQQSCLTDSSLKVADLERFCIKNQATIQALGQTAWALLLAAYTGNDDIVFGTVFSGQTTTESHGVAFPSINTIPVPCKTGQSLQKVIKSMVDFNGASQRHRFLPLWDIQNYAGHPDRMLFDTLFVYQKSSARSSPFNWPILREHAAVDYCASLELESHGNDVISIHLTHNTAMIPPRQAQLIVQQYDHILYELVLGRKSDLLISNSIFSICPPLEPTLPSEVNLLHEFVERSALQYPSRTALEFVREATTEIWSYEMLESIANQVAHLIQRFGVQQNSIIAVCMDKCPEASFAFVGILKAGCSFLAIDPDLPESRLRFILEDSRSQLLFGNQRGEPPGVPDSTKYFQLTESSVASLPRSPIARGSAQSDATCYCLYTSGTTGTPKGCEISHKNAVQAMLAFTRLFKGRWNDSSKWLQFASYWFDVSILEHFWSWAVGITVVGAPRDIVLEDLSGFIRKLNITHIDLTPSLARLVRPAEVPSLCNGVFITGGEPLKQEIIKAWGPAKTVCNGYGPTEATIGVTMNTFIGSDAKSSNIGRQFDNVGTYVLQAGSDEPVIRGAIGELCISGKLVGKGYLNRPDLTAKHFPFLQRFSETIYRTGDLVRMLDDGSFAFVGRADSQSKLRGQRLELSEVENAIRRSSEQIHDVVTLVTKTQEGAKEVLLSFITTGPHRRSEQLRFDSSATSVELAQSVKDACTSRLPGYMVPTYVLVVNHLPLTVNNKIDTKQLTAMFYAASMRELQALQRKDKAIRTLSGTEQKICDILCRLLEVDSTSMTPESNLFSLGLSSISAIPFTRLLKQAGFQSTNIGLVMRNATIERLCYALRGAPQHQAQDHATKQAQLWITAFHHRHLLTAANSLEVCVDDIEAVLPCTPLQQGLIIESLKDESRPHFNHFLYEVVATDLSRVKRSLEMLAAVTQILRTRFVEVDEGLAQIVLRHSNVDLRTRAVPSAQLHSVVLELRDVWHSRNEAVLRVPIEFHLIDAGDNCYLSVHIHHAIYDGISYQLMLRQLHEIYGSKHSTEAIPRFTTALAHGPLRSIEGAKAFWKHRLRDTTYVPLPRLESSGISRSVEVCFTVEKTGAIESARKTLGVSHQALIQACFEIALHRQIGSIKLYGVVCSGRSIDFEGADLVMGPMFNTLPQPMNLELSSSIAKHVQKCHSSNTESIPYQHTPLRDIRKWCGHQFSAGIFDILFVFQHLPDSSQSESEQVLKHVEEAPRAHYPLACETEMDDEGRMAITLRAQDTFFNLEALQGLRTKICQALDYLVDQPHTILQDFTGSTIRDDAWHDLMHHNPSRHVNRVENYTWTANGLRIREIVSELAEVDFDDVDEHSSVFALGLDSIDAVKLASRLKRVGLSISVSAILKAQTIPKILEMVKMQSVVYETNGHTSALERKQQRIKRELVHFAPVAEDTEQFLPATPFQEALLAIMLRSGLKQYFNHDIMRLGPDTEIERLVSAWQLVVDSSPILRTSFLELPDPSHESTFAQIVRAPAPLQIPSFEVDNIKEVDWVFEKIRLDVLNTYECYPLLRLSLLRVQSQQYFILSLSHALYDGHSIALLHNDAHHAYSDKFTARPPYDDAVDVAFEVPEDESRAYWRSMLSYDHTPSFPRIAWTEEPSKITRAEQCSDISAGTARAFCKDYGISMQALAQTCWAITLAHYIHSLDVQFGVVLACRDSEEREQMMFPMMNTVVMRSSLHGSRGQMVQYMQGLVTNMRPYQRTPLRKIQSFVSRSGSHSSTIGNGLFDTLFIYQQRPATTISNTERLYESVYSHSTVEYPVAVEMEAVGEKLMIRTACASNVLDDTGCVQLLEKVESVLQAIIHDPSRPTVEFHADKVSLCSLEPIHLHTTREAPLTVDEVPVEQEDESEYSASPMMNTIVEILSQVSKTPQSEISPRSTIESIGIDSISAIKVAALLRKQSISTPVSEILRAKTPARIAQIASERTDSNTTMNEAERGGVLPHYDVSAVADSMDLDADNIEAILPATAGQAYMLSMWKKSYGQQFNSTFSYRLKIGLTLEQIEHAWSVLVDRHTILRTVFCVTSDTDMSVLQVVLRDAPGNFDPNERAVARQPMVSMHATPESHGFTIELKIHHALYDAVSLPLLLEDFQTLFAGRTTDTPNLKFEEFLAISTAPKAKESRKQFWTQYLEGAKPRQLGQPSTSGAQDRMEIFKPALFFGASELESKARKESLSIQALLFAAYAKVYANIAHSRANDDPDDERNDVIIGIYLSNRSHLVGLERLPAPTLNLVPLLVRRPEEQSLISVARKIQVDLQEISTAENSTVELAEIYEWAGVRVDTFVNFLKLPERAERLVVEGDESSVVLEELDDRRTRERCEVIVTKEEEWEVPSELASLKTDAYQHSLDIEMLITGGKLGVGLFCPQSMVGLDEGQEVLEELKSILEKIVGKQKQLSELNNAE